MFIVDGDRQRAIYKNKITIRANIDNKIFDIEFINVYYVLDFDVNFVSHKKLRVKNVRIEEREQFTFSKEDHIIYYIN